ncbi:nucleotidyltransferase domain-containing protein [Cyanobium sp. T1B-Tous]|uniref:nucleotidyltransferase domain-containing protein n=1 Tax=Cyanobium sp. T1B-Tous TaxID=2823721 RepID=UPI0020CE8DA0|nr:nucleotidyltransferase domain-containing protein [Cyanobium sp. T1B-Tous]MCP9806736.1 nucleotidyltransferase domain-containing protein [Cyanobium sp. T1B-Tous]
MAALSTLGRIRQARHESWLADLRRKTEEVGQACVKQGIGIEQVLLFGSRARGDFDGHSDVDLIAVGTTQQDAEAVADALADAHLGDDLIAMSRESWQRKARASHPTWRATFSEAVPIFQRGS